MIGLELVRDGTATRLSVESADSGLTTTRRFARADGLKILCKKAIISAGNDLRKDQIWRKEEEEEGRELSFLPRPIAAVRPPLSGLSARLACAPPYRCWWRCRPRIGLLGL